MLYHNISRSLAAFCAAIVVMVGSLGASPVWATCLTCDTPIPSSLALTGQVATGGTGLAVFGGVDGSAFTDKFGNANIDITLGSTGGLCTTPNCASGNGGLTASFSETVMSGAYGVSDVVGTPAAAANQLASNGLIAAQFPNGFGIELGATTQAAGQAGAAFAGDNGIAFTNVFGVTSNTGDLTVNGVCPTCQSGNFNLTTGAVLGGNAEASAFSHTAGKAAEVINNLGFAAGLSLTVGATD